MAGGEFACDVDLFDAERDAFPYPVGHFSLVLCCEMLEHLLLDAMHMLLEIRRVLEPGGSLLLTTPNCASLTSLGNILHGRHNPQVYSNYTRGATGERPHVREYTPWELTRLLEGAGFVVETLFTERRPDADSADWVRDVLVRNGCETRWRGEQTYSMVRVNKGAAIDRWPAWLYT